MNISPVSSQAYSGSASVDGNKLAQLNKKLLDLQKEVKDESVSKTDDAKTKADKIKELQSEIQEVQIEIEQEQAKAAKKNGQKQPVIQNPAPDANQSGSSQKNSVNDTLDVVA
jgi:sucrose-6-phosphate hydrolase SacC (GH32 family)